MVKAEAYVQIMPDDNPLKELENRVKELNEALEKASQIMAELANTEIHIPVNYEFKNQNGNSCL